MLAPADWKGFLHQHLLTHSTDDAMVGLARAGCKLTYTPIARETFLQDEADGNATNLDTSLGLTIGANGNVRSVVWDGPAFSVGLAPGKRIVAIDGQPFSRTALLAATNASGSVPVRLTL